MGAYDSETSSLKYQAAIELEEHTLFALLKPSLKRDGNQWCVLYGENLQEGVSGFGASPHEAVEEFNNAWYKRLPESEIFPGTKNDLNNISLYGEQANGQQNTN